MAMDDIHTIEQVAVKLGTQAWRIRRLYECGEIAEPPRFGRSRVLTDQDVPRIVTALKRRGWLPQTTPTA